jgi:hypothetical protein
MEAEKNNDKPQDLFAPVRKEIADNQRHLRSDQVIDIYQKYGIDYDIPDVNTYRLVCLLDSAERILMAMDSRI